MKKKIILSVLIILAIALIIFGIRLHATNNLQEASADVEQEKIEIPLEWHGKYIWNAINENNTWMCFRKKFDLEENLSNVIAQIAVDSQYWLYINGEIVVREGGLKRGETPNSIYYDEIDISKYLQKGENTIAILAWYWGDEGYSYNPSGRAAMLFQARIGETYLISDETWKVNQPQAYLKDWNIPNYRLAEYNVYYNATLAQENWYLPEFDDTLWENAEVLGIAGDAPWGEMIERDIPQFQYDELKEYENMAEYKDYTTTKKETLEMLIPYNAQINPYLKIEAPAGLNITIKTDMYEDINGDSIMSTYITKEGIQEFESLVWINGEKVYYEIPKGVKIISLGYRETGYDTQMIGKFECDDDFFNSLWQKSVRTLYVNMRDTYMDCPNRERAQWWGDASIEMLEAMYCLDTKAYNLYEKGVKTTINWTSNDVLPTVVPISNDNLHLPIQMLLGINSMYEYYEYTGKKEFLEYIYPSLKNYLNLWQVNEKGLMHSSVTYPIWEWGDSAGNVDYEILENMWYYLALNRVCQMSEILEYQEDTASYRQTIENLKMNLNQFWTPEGYKTPDCKYVDERANAIAVISGLADKEKYSTISNLFQTSYESSVIMEKYILEAMCQMGNIEEAQNRIAYRYDEMVSGEKACSTLWENWDYSVSSKNHAWAGGPLVIMSKYFAGIEPFEKGYDTVSIKPQFGKLQQISANVTTIKGDIKLEAKKSEQSIQIKLTTPSKAHIAVEKLIENPQIIINEQVVYENGENKKAKVAKYDTEDEKYVYFYIDNGEYEIECK